MSGHNRWSKIKRQKAAMGASKGKLFNKIIKELSVAARMGGGDPANNARLRAAVSAAREANIPGDSVQRAIKRGTGELEGSHYEEIQYEGYGPGGVAVLVDCLTDNRNRTAGEVRSAFSKFGGNMAAEGSVGWVFSKKGAIQVKPGPAEDQVLEKALEAGAEDVLNQGEDGFEVRCDPHALHTVGAALEEAGLALGDRKVAYLPQNTVRLEGDNAKKMLKLLEILEDNDDVQDVHANFEMDDELLEAAS